MNQSVVLMKIPRHGHLSMFLVADDVYGYGFTKAI